MSPCERAILLRAQAELDAIFPDIDFDFGQFDSDRDGPRCVRTGVTRPTEAVTGNYPWENADVPPNTKPRGIHDNGQGLRICPRPSSQSCLGRRPRRTDRYASGLDLADALRALRILRQQNLAKERQISTQSLRVLAPAGVPQPNTNPFVSYLLTLYSQSRQTNAGTRGLDAMGRLVYVETALDRVLQPAILAGEFRLVLITGNAGDGKTAFIQQVEGTARDRGAAVSAYGSGNGSAFQLDGRHFRTNYDGSQDEGDKINDDVLRQFFSPFAGIDSASWPAASIIDCDQRRTADRFLGAVWRRFPVFETIDQARTSHWNCRRWHCRRESRPAQRCRVLRRFPSILERMVKRLVEPTFWGALPQL